MTGSAVSYAPTMPSSYGCRVTAIGGAALQSGEGPWFQPGARAEAQIRFRGCRLLPASRILLRDEVPVELGSRAFDLLHVLAKARGSMVSKDELLRQVWPTTIVEESNLRFQVAMLRKALGPDRDLIKTVPGRSYHFAVESLGGAVTPSVHELSASDMTVLTLLGRAVGETGSSQGAGRAARPAEAGESIETLRGLLQLVLHELREMTGRETAVMPGHEPAPLYDAT